jgi:hypothetical protein
MLPFLSFTSPSYFLKMASPEQPEIYLSISDFPCLLDTSALAKGDYVFKVNSLLL